MKENVSSSEKVNEQLNVFKHEFISDSVSIGYPLVNIVETEKKVENKTLKEPYYF